MPIVFCSCSDFVRFHILTVSYDKLFLWMWYVCTLGFLHCISIYLFIHLFLCILGINVPTSQSFLNYVLLAIVYGITMILRKRALKVALYASPFFRSFHHWMIWLLLHLESNKFIYLMDCLLMKLSIFLIWHSSYMWTLCPACIFIQLLSITFGSLGL